jgi:hypothetical protein
MDNLLLFLNEIILETNINKCTICIRNKLINFLNSIPYTEIDGCNLCIINEFQKIFIGYHEHVDWDMFNIISNPNITLKFIENYPNFNWDAAVVRMKRNQILYPNINNNGIETCGIAYTNNDKYYDYELNENYQQVCKLDDDYQSVYSNNISEDNTCSYETVIELIKQLDRNTKSDWNILSSSMYITFDFVKNNINQAWNWYLLSKNTIITIDSITKNIDLPWNKKGLYLNPNITDKFFVLYPQFIIANYTKPTEIIGLNSSLYTTEYDWHFLSSSTNISLLFIKENINKPWDINLLSCNPIVTMKFVEDNINVEFLDYKSDTTNSGIIKKRSWCAHGLSSNPNLTKEFIDNHPEIIWNWNLIAVNKFKYDEILIKLHLDKLKKFRRKVKSLRIKKWYKLHLLTKTKAFVEWYCSPGNIGNIVDKKRIENVVTSKDN